MARTPYHRRTLALDGPGPLLRALHQHLGYRHPVTVLPYSTPQNWMDTLHVGSNGIIIDRMSESVSNWYDGFSAHQTRMGINIRHRTILRNARRAGLQNGMHVLEIGCGIGTVTSLLAKATPRGSVLGVDISPKSIEIARKNLARFKQVEFLVSDMSDFKHPRVFDLVVLPDVIEHIPIEQHNALFGVIAAHLAPHGRILINVPNAQLLEYMHRHHPETLQVIDQPIHLDGLMRVAYGNGLVLEELHGYGLRYRLAEYTSVVLRPAYTVEALPERSKISRIIHELWARTFR